MRCYLCQSTDFSIRKGSVRDNDQLQILECQNCGLVQLSSQAHLQQGHYENSGMHGADPEPIEVWERNTAEDDNRRFEMLKTLLPNQRILDFGCGNGGFLKKAQELASGVTGIEPELRVREHLRDKLQVLPGLSDLRGGGGVRSDHRVSCSRASARSTLHFERFQKPFEPEWSNRA